MPPRLTAKIIADTPLPERGRIELRDGAVPGLVIRIAASGVKTWALYYFYNQKKKRHTLGKFPDMSVANARAKAIEVRAKLEDGIDPNGAALAGDTFDSLVEAFIRLEARGPAHVKGKAGAKPRNRTWAEQEYLLRKYAVPALKGKGVREIRRRDIIAILNPLADRPAQQRKVYRITGRVFNWAVGQDIIDSSPATGIPIRNLGARNRPLTPAEIKAFWEATFELGYPFGPCYRLLLATCARLGEVSEMTWSELDLDGKAWSLAAGRTKAKRAHVLPLTPLALEIIESVPRQAGDYLFSFNGRTPVKGHHLGKTRLVAIAGEKALPDFKLKDLRETGATIMRRDLGVSSDVVGQVLNHAPAGVTQVHYASQKSPVEMRRALEAWDGYLRGILPRGQGD